MWFFVGALEIPGGLFLFSGRFATQGLLVLAPIIVNIVAYLVSLQAPIGVPPLPWPGFSCARPGVLRTRDVPGGWAPSSTPKPHEDGRGTAGSPRSRGGLFYRIAQVNQIINVRQAFHDLRFGHSGADEAHDPDLAARDSF